MHRYLFSKLAARMGAQFHGVLISACNFLVARIVVWERISCLYSRSRGSLSANFCTMFIAFLQPEIQSAINLSLSPLLTNIKRLEPTNL